MLSSFLGTVFGLIFVTILAVGGLITVTLFAVKGIIRLFYWLFENPNKKKGGDNS